MSSFDDLRIYGSGAGADGGAQALETANLGAFRSSSEWPALAVFGAMERISVQRVGENNIAGAGAMESDGAGKLRWTAPGSDTAGAWTTVSDGVPVVLPDGSYADKSLRVLRSGAAPAAGLRELKLLDIFNGAFAMGNVSDAQRTAGLITYRCLFLKNSGSTTITYLRFAPQSSALAVAIEAPSVQPNGFVQTIAGETVAPIGLSWVASGSAAEIWNLAAGNIYGLWLRRTIAAGASASARSELALSVEHYQ